MIKQISEQRKLKKIALATSTVLMGVAIAASISSFSSDSGSGGSGSGGSGGGCSTSEHLYDKFKDSDGAQNVECYTCVLTDIKVSVELDSLGQEIGAYYKRNKQKAYVTRRDCKYHTSPDAQCNEISVTNVDPTCDNVFVPKSTTP